MEGKKFKVGDLVKYPHDDRIYEITGVPGDPKYDSYGFLSAELGCTIKVLGSKLDGERAPWTFSKSLMLVNTEAVWEV